jgi:hypothetical protein
MISFYSLHHFLFCSVCQHEVFLKAVLPLNSLHLNLRVPSCRMGIAPTSLTCSGDGQLILTPLAIREALAAAAADTVMQLQHIFPVGEAMVLEEVELPPAVTPLDLPHTLLTDAGLSLPPSISKPEVQQVCPII